MTKEAICKILEMLIIRHGFTFEYQNHTWLPVVHQTSDDYAGIIFLEHWDFNREAMTCTTSITCQARVCRMGGNDSYDDLIRASEQIREAAELMQEVNERALTYTESFGA